VSVLIVKVSCVPFSKILFASFILPSPRMYSSSLIEIHALTQQIQKLMAMVNVRVEVYKESEKG